MNKAMRLHSTLQEVKVLKPDEVEQIVAALARACADLPVILLYLHGAHARGTQSALSDFDIAVLMEHDAARDRRKRVELHTSLEEVCGREDMDLVVLNTAGSIIKDRVVRNGRLVYARSERDRVIFEEGAVKEALDFQYYSRIYDEVLFKQLKEGRYLG